MPQTLHGRRSIHKNERESNFICNLDYFVWLIGFLKVSLATLLVIGIYINSLVFPASVGMAILMVGAIAMHIKVKDEMIKSLPATIFLFLSLSVAFL